MMYHKTTKSLLMPLFVLVEFIFNICAQDGPTDTLSNQIQCFPEVVFSFKGNSQSLCLNRFDPLGDSCAEVSVIFKNLGIKINFSYNKNHLWNYNGLGYSNHKSQNLPANISLSTDEAGSIKFASIFFGHNSDSSDLWLQPFRNGDIPVIPDSTKPLDYDINLVKFICVDKPKHTVVTDRKFSYPAGFRRKEQILNYPELSAFHWGGSVKMPSAASVRNLGYYIVECHILHPPKIQYEDPEVLRRRELYNAKWEKRHPPKVKKKRTKPPLLRFKPL